MGYQESQNLEDLCTSLQVPGTDSGLIVLFVELFTLVCTSSDCVQNFQRGSGAVAMPFPLVSMTWPWM